MNEPDGQMYVDADLVIAKVNASWQEIAGGLVSDKGRLEAFIQTQQKAMNEQGKELADVRERSSQLAGRNADLEEMVSVLQARLAEHGPPEKT